MSAGGPLNGESEAMVDVGNGRVDGLADWVANQLAIVRATPAHVSRDFDRDFPVEELGRTLGLQPESLNRLVLAELTQLAQDIETETRQRDLAQPDVATLRTIVRDKLQRPDSHPARMLSTLLPSIDVTDAKKHDPPTGVRQRLTRPLQRAVTALWMNILIATTIAVAALLLYWGFGAPPAPPAALLSVFAIWVASFLPGWMFVRFIGQRAGALWDEYVIYLHRLRLDDPCYLPMPPPSSRYYKEWLDAGGRQQSGKRNIYRQKFDAYYGKAVSRAVQDPDWRLPTDTLFPLFLATAVFAICWTALLWPPGLSTQPSTLLDMLKYAFIGAYAFIVQMLIRRFFQSDLRASAYASAVLRVIVVAITIPVVHQLYPYLSGSGIGPRPSEAVVAFVVGFFPLVAMQALTRTAAFFLRVFVPTLTTEYPLSQLDGLNIWYEARLIEEGIEDMQNLATANLVDVILHTKVPVGRLIDWVDQAYLYIHLDRTERNRHEEQKNRRRAQKAAKSGRGKPGDNTVRAAGAEEIRAIYDFEGRRLGSRTKAALNQMGIRSAIKLTETFPGGMKHIDDPRLGHLEEDFGVRPSTILTIAEILGKEPGLNPVRSWRARGSVDPYIPQRQPEPATC
ncbi:MAG TPA: hypothetical protein VF003_18845 [Pseudonocardiaceae bacterium]